MRERDINAQKFHKGHYEIIAKRFRVALEPYMNDEVPVALQIKPEVMAVRAALVGLAIDFAKRLQADNELFEPEIFLNRCSPNPELYPLSELWEVAQDDVTA